MITKDGALICEYFYDAFGNCKVFNSNGEENTSSSFIGNINPFRWKSHYLDTETNLYYANGSYYDPSISEHVDAVRFSSIIDNAFIPFSLNPNGIMCNNILGYIPNTDNIETSQELSVNPAYDINANKPWWETMWASMLRWFYDLDIKIKIGIGLGLFLFACIITIFNTIVSHGTATSLSLALGQLTLEFAVGVISSIAISTIIALAKDEPVKDAFVHGLADGIFFGGIFAFISSCINLIKTIARGIQNTRPISQVNYDSDFLPWLNSGDTNNVVYKGIADDGNAVYTGITKQKLSVRLYQHNRAGKDFIRLDSVYTNLTRNQARSIETYLIINDGASNMNKILSISRNSEFFNQAMSWAKSVILGG